VSTEVAFWNPSEVRIFSELVYTSSESTELYVQNSAEFRGKNCTEFCKKTLLHRNYCNSEKVAVLCLQWTRKKKHEWRYGNMYIGNHSDMVTWRHGNMSHGNMDMGVRDMETC
jgi:hypothetical protein